jgi:hypothetical protein
MIGAGIDDAELDEPLAAGVTDRVEPMRLGEAREPQHNELRYEAAAHARGSTVARKILTDCAETPKLGKAREAGTSNPRALSDR